MVAIAWALSGFELECGFRGHGDLYFGKLGRGSLEAVAGGY
jgi:hypothetical protein